MKTTLLTVALLLVSGTATWAEPAQKGPEAAVRTIHMDAQNPKSSWLKGQGWTYKGGYTPSRLAVKQGETVTIRLESVGGTHCFNIPELNVHSKKVVAGQSTAITFVPSKTGEFDFRCECEGPNHEFMSGKIVVSPK